MVYSLRTRSDFRQMMDRDPEPGEMADRVSGETDIREGLALIAEVLKHHPDHPSVHMQAAVACNIVGDHGRAGAHMEHALEHMNPDDPEYAAARRYRATQILRDGDLGRGFPEFNLWTERDTNRCVNFTLRSPWWRSGSLEGRRIVLHGVLDGHGDAFQFVRYASKGLAPYCWSATPRRQGSWQPAPGSIA
jgi:hypothetical protein